MSNVPKLRFKEFSGDWESKKLGELGEFFKGSTLSKTNLSEEGKPCILYGELYTKYGEVIKKAISKTNLDDSKLVIGKKNDVLIPSSGESAIDIATASCLQEDDVILGGDLNIFRSDKVNGVFASYQLNTSKKNEIAKLAQGASVVHIYNTQLSKLKLNIPKLEEQEKIASFFSLIDDKISLQGEKVEALKDYKKGMMQKIFSRELRFKDDCGMDYPEWEENKLGDISTIVGGGTPSTTEEQYWNGEIQWFTPTEIKGQKFVSISTRTITNEGLRKSSAKILPKGTILLTTRASLGDMAIADNEVTTNQGFQSIIANDNVNNQFIYYLQDKIKKYCYKNASGSTFLEINKKTIENFKLTVPCVEEQNKIVTILSSIDKKLEIEKEKLDSLNEYKKGLLQQMFI